ncbi:glycosyltransferase 87 family protein [Gordonia insulae]|uniref:Polyprenol-phosphate-mannose-dependent alpha-(1-2)-phosphatidylinositol mannoside mannosyltransferase n=1 Tax=Gordonia insulae TaxID=2420509 RepID=A0A3G8JET2_9ACTN|nr:glycosyltransferase 87 family protein [Gordonia insulae]AZG43681.1 Polyprenol-phosphate-mannose-dependent alpha-(1-2)-phosphatidylinositol mannoside mannosyltransferase [Gordonia insulae]
MSYLTEADTRLRRWAPSRRARAAIAVVFAASVTLQIVGIPFTSSFGTRTRIDLDVYRLGAQIWQHGQSLYADGSMPFTSDGIWLPFTYPPFAAIGFVPLGALGLDVAGLLISVLTVVLTIVVLHILLGVLGVGTGANRWWTALLIGAGAVWLNPLWMTLGFGQINIILMTMIVVDIFVIGRGRATPAAPFGGVLTGIAAAVKLTPFVFVAVFLAARQWRRAVAAVGAFLGAGALAWVWLPADSLDYWTHTLFHTTRIGDPAGRINQNLNAMWIRLVPHSESAQQLLWVLSSLVVTLLAFAAVHACRPVSAFASLRSPSSDDPAAGVATVLITCVVAVWGLLVSPTSWAHHWVWSIPMILAAAVIAARSVDRRVRTAYTALAVAGLVIFALGPFQFLSPAVRQWSAVDHLIGNSYTLWGLAVLLVVWLLPPPVTGTGTTGARPAMAGAQAP